MATYNGARFIRQSIGSLLAQTEPGFDLIVVDDCSTDDTQAILASINDPRLTVVRNETNSGVVASRNRCLSLATGEYVAMQDHDDLSRPTRLAQQAAYLDEHPDIALVATAANSFQDGLVLPLRAPHHSSPALIAWLLLVANPLVCSSIMIRASSLRQLDAFMRPDYTYADDYDLYHRIMHVGGIARLDVPLTLYRLHDGMASRAHETLMSQNAVRVLVPAYTSWFGADALDAASLVVHHVASVRAVPDLVTLRRLQQILRHLTASFFETHATTPPDRDLILDHAEHIWKSVVRNTVLHARLTIGPAEHSLHLPPDRSLARTAKNAIHRLPFQTALRRIGRDLRDAPRRPARALRPRKFLGTSLDPISQDLSYPPTLFVVVDTEAEFDWSRPLNRALTSVAAIEHIGRGQAVFDRWGLRPVYVVDYPIATNPFSIVRLREILDRGGCEIGAHLHPWTTPPFDESVADRNSYPGNLPAHLEREKLRCLVAAIEQSFGTRPLFYKAGRYGFGPHTAETLASLGFKVDFSMLPGADLSGKGGPDFTGVEATLYRLGPHGLLTAPMTRSVVGLFPWLGRWAERIGPRSALASLPLRPILARTRLANTITLTPEGVTTKEQIRLLRALLARGQRQFVLHYHSPTMAAGNTSYTPNDVAVGHFVESLQDVCRFFFDEIGGLPGYPRDLISVAHSTVPSKTPLDPSRQQTVDAGY